TPVAGETYTLRISEPAGIKTTYPLPPVKADGVVLSTASDVSGRGKVVRLRVGRPSAGKVRVTLAKRDVELASKAVAFAAATGDDGRPAPAVVGLTVTDDSVLEMIEKREQPPRLPAAVLLEGEVRELADAHVYLDPSNPKAPLATDLLLGTQGWRRFAFVGRE